MSEMRNLVGQPVTVGGRTRRDQLVMTPDAIEAFAAAWYRASGFRKDQINPRWEMVDPIIQKAWREAASRYIAGGRLREPKLRMEQRYAPDGTRLNDEWVPG